MKKGKEISIKSNKNYSVYSGTLNNKIAKTIYLNISGWGEPKLDNDINYERVIRELRKRISQHVYNNLSDNDFKKNNTIVDLDMRFSGVHYGKKSFMSCEVTLFQNSNNPINSPLTINRMTNLSNMVIEDILENNDYFKFTKSK